MTTLKECREGKGLTQEQLAVAANVSRLTIINLENGHSKTTTAGTLRSLSEALDVSMDDLFSMLSLSSTADSESKQG